MQRSNTTSQTNFCLPNSDGEPAAIFDFENEGSFRVTVPSNSKWKYWYHWESQDASLCSAVNVLEGKIVISIAYSLRSGLVFGGKGTKRSFEPSTRRGWRNSNYTKRSRDPVDLVVNLVGDEAFHRNVCSAILDRERMASLASTPILLRLFLSLLAIFAPSAREWILDMMLAIQLRMMFYDHGFWVIHWMFPALVRPQWQSACRLVWRMQKGATYTVQGLCYWVGRLFLGMKGRYPEYTPSSRRVRGPLSSEKGNDENQDLESTRPLL